MMNTIKTTTGNWKIRGINLISSDSIYQKVKSAIESGNLSQSFIQKETGHLAPIEVNMAEQSITFSNF